MKFKITKDELLKAMEENYDSGNTYFLADFLNDEIEVEGEVIGEKEKSGEFFKATELAIQILTASPGFKTLNDKDTRALVVDWRDYFLKGWENHG